MKHSRLPNAREDLLTEHRRVRLDGQRDGGGGRWIRAADDALNAPECAPWTLVDAVWTPKRKVAVSADNRSGS